MTIPDWVRRSYRVFHENLIAREYPCYFGSIAEKQGDVRYAYVEGEDHTHLPETLETFVDIVRTNLQRQLVLTLFYQPEAEARPHDYYEAKFWELLRFLHQHDPHPWPNGHASDPADPLWEFAFGGMTMFVFSAAPTYKVRRSRNLGEGMLVFFQPRNVFNGIEGDTPAGDKVRKIIRDRLVAWDEVAPHPHLGSYGNPLSLEWKQYFLPDDNSHITAECPFKSKHRSEKQ